MAAPRLVIKVKYGETLRRFNASVVDGDLDFDMDGLREKVGSLFSFSPDTELLLSYVDEDGDMVALVDNEDLHDVVKQSLNPVRIHVKLDSGKNSYPFSRSSESSTPLRSPHVQETSQNLNSDMLGTLKDLQNQFATSTAQLPLHNLNSGVSQIFQTVKVPLHEALVKLSSDFAAKASTSAPGVTEVADILSKLVLSTQDNPSNAHPKEKPSTQKNVPESSSQNPNSDILGTLKDLQIQFATSTAQQLPLHNLNSGKSAVPDSSTVVRGTADSGKSEVDSSTLKVSTNDKSNEQLLKTNETVSIPQTDASMEKNELKHAKLKKAASSKAHELGGSPFASTVGKKEKVKKERLKKLLSECYANEKSRIKSSHQPPLAANGLFVGKFNEFRNSIDLQSSANNVSAGQEPLSGRKTSDASYWGVKTWGFPHRDGLSYSPFNGSMNECPFSGAVGNFPAPPCAVPQPFPFRNTTIPNDGNGVVFHRGVRCDGCGVHPITGPRFKSKVNVDYDLCSICFSRMGNETEYMRMDRPAPALYRPPVPFKGLYGSIAGPTMPQACKGVKVKLGSSKFDSRFIQDINIIDGTVLAPLTPFTKIWRMRNNGTVVWPQRTQLLWIGGDKLSSQTSVEVAIPAEGLPVEAELDVEVDFVAPELPGRYISYWRMAAPSGQKFGQRVWVLIQVDSSIQSTSSETVRGFNLNLPPLAPAAPEHINLGIEPIMLDGQTVPDSSKTVESVEPVVNVEQPMQSNLEHELKFPINDSLLIGSGAMDSIPSSSSSVSYPMIDLTPVAAPDFPSAVSPSASVVNSEAEHHLGTLETEVALLIELEEMGFTEVELNREVLRGNEYNLEKTVDVLCGVADWDPILEELQEMGFHDTEVNKKLLEKNNGSIKRVVMDLIAEETKM